MVKPFFSKRFPIFGTYAMLIMCAVYFLLPFAFRGARLAIGSMQNNVADWLPSDYEETKELREFQKYFSGGSFVVASGPWCHEGDQVFTNFVRKLREESLEYESELRETKREEELRAHRKGDELGLLYSGDYHQRWGEQNEKWLQGKEGQWYWINRQGELYRWDGQNNVIQGGKRVLERMFNGRNRAIGKYIDTFGEPPDDEAGIENEFYADPQKLCARPFKSVTTGPEIFEQMAGENGTLRIGDFGDDSKSSISAKLEAHKRLTGALFGPTPAASFQWTFESLLQHVDDNSILATLRSDKRYRDLFERYIEVQVAERYDGDFNRLLTASPDDRLEIWYGLWGDALQLDAPARQTCIIITLNEPIYSELERAVGRPLLGKPRGRILEVATGECGISPENLHLGGPPQDNVAIDEEGTVTLLRLVSLSLIIGVSLAYFSFRSIRVTMMLFFVGGVAAISGLSYVWFAGSTLDAILMSMPSLVYVLGLSGAVHIVNYYRDACHESGPETAAEVAVKHGWFPCTLAAFTTALGLVSLCTSNLTPIQKFGFFSAVATMATVILLFTYLPSALTIWPPGYQKQVGNVPEKRGSLAAFVSRMWGVIGEFVIRRHGIVAVLSLALMAFFAYGITKVETSVHLLKLFDQDSKIIEDYRWMENNLGKLVPMEIVVCVDEDSQKEAWLEKQRERALTARNKKLLANGQPIPDPAEDDFQFEYDEQEYELKYSILERMEMSARVRNQLERFFGPNGLQYVGSGMSTDVFVPLQMIDTQYDPGLGNTSALKINNRFAFNTQLKSKYEQMLSEDYLAVAGKSNLDYLEAMADKSDPDVFGREMWRVSLRLAALSDVDYGQFVADIKSVVEPIMSAYRKRSKILLSLQEQIGAERSMTEGKILVLGRNPDRISEELQSIDTSKPMSELVDQTFIFSDTLQDLFENRGFINVEKKGTAKKFYYWLDPTTALRDRFPNAGLSAEERQKREKALAGFIQRFDVVISIEDHELLDMDFFAENARNLIDCRDHQFLIDHERKQPLTGQVTAMQAKRGGDSVDVSAIYTGVIPIVYKAQNQLLRSLINSITLAFGMIAVVMMLLLRNWREPLGPKTVFNVSGGMLSMLPNIFPVLIVFGALGHLGQKVDIGSMMTASVAMGVAVDDTIHFLNWYRKGLAEGMKRVDAIRLAYDRVATAMTQTTLIGGLGLSAFALSTFTPTQRFGTLMLFLLAAALVGDLIFLPAILASPLGRFFGKERPRSEADQSEAVGPDADARPAIRVLTDQDSQRAGRESNLPGEGDFEVHPDSFRHVRPPDEATG